MTQKLFCKDSNPYQNILAGVASSKSGLLGDPLHYRSFSIFRLALSITSVFKEAK